MRWDRSRAEGIVGREAELADLLRSADTARMVLLSGDAGVGKTRLLAEVGDRLAGRGWRTLVGHCLDFGETSMPYLPFAEMLDQVEETRLAQEHPELAAQLGSSLPALAGLRRPSTGQDPAEDLDRAEVFEAVHAVLDTLTEVGPVALVVEDAHWADASTRDLLSFLLSRRFRGRIWILVTFRSDEMHRRHPLRQRVAEWVRLPDVERVQLDPLPAGAVRAIVEQIVGGAAASGTLGEEHDDDVARIVQRAQGNPFYVEELVSAFLGGGWSLPEDLADLLLVRLDRLDERAREVVRIASAAGQRVSHDLLARVAPLPHDELDVALRAALEAHVLVRTGSTEYAFRHALLGEAVYDDLLPGERMRLHTAYAAAVRDLLGPRGAADLARHALASHDLPTALEASVEAGDQALSAGGPEEAAKHYARALEIYGRAAGQLDAPPDETELVGRTVDALCSSGRPETALALVDHHLDRLPADAPALARARLLLARFEALRATEAETRPSTVSREGLDLVGPEPTVLRARLLAMHAQALVWDDRYDEAHAVADEAIELAEELGLPRLSAEVSLTLTWLSQHLDFGEGARADLKRIISEARVRGDRFSELRGFLRTGGLELEHGALERAEEAFLTASSLAVALGRPWTMPGISGRTQAGIAAYMRGAWDRALEIVDHRDEDPPPTPRAMLGSVELLVAAGRGEVAALRQLPSLRERWHREGLVAVVAGGAAIDLLALRDGAAAAVATYDDLVGVLVPLWGDRFDAIPRLAAQTLSALADEAPRTATGARAGVLARADALVADARRTLDGRARDGRPFAVEGRAWEARLHAERLRLDWLAGVPVDLAELVDRWRAAAETFAELGHPLEEARARTRLAAVLRASGHLEPARAEATRARDLATPLGARPLLEELGGAARAGADSSPLTPREHEVLELVAAGRGNAEIGTQLFISAKTVSVHVSNVMAKLGAASRTEAVALARQRGLLD